MAEQEACASAVTDALAAGGGATGDAADARGESLLLPLLQGLLGNGGEKLLAGLGAAGADVVADVRRSLGRLRAALQPPAQHPQARALLALADRLEDALRAADRLDGVRRRPRRRPRAARHTVGVTSEELEQARRLVDRDQLQLHEPEPPPGSASISAGSTASTAHSGEPTPERRPSIDEEIQFHDAVAPTSPPQRRVQIVQPPAPGVEPPAPAYSQPPQTNGYHSQPVERRAPAVKRPDFFRHSIADAPAPPPSQALPRMERRPSERSGIAAIADKFNAQIQKENAPPPMRRVPPPPQPVSAPVLQHRPAPREDRSRAPLYKPLPPTYNFAAPPPAEEPSKPLSRFNSNKRNRMKRANTIDIGRPLAGYRLDSDTDEDAPRGSLVPPFRPQTDNDRKFVAFMQRNNEQQQANGHANWSNRFGNIKHAFESRERDDPGRSPVGSRGPSWQRAEPPRTPRRPPLERTPSGEAPPPPWVSERRPAPRAPPTSLPTPPSPQRSVAPPAFPSVPQSPTKPVVVKPFAAKPIPVNQFSHAPMSAFKPPMKIVSPTGAPAALVWSPPSVTAVSPTGASPSWPRRNAELASRFESPRAGPPAPRVPEALPRPSAHPPSPGPPRPIPSLNELAAPELVKKVDTSRPPYEPTSPRYEPPPRQLFHSASQKFESPRQTYRPPPVSNGRADPPEIDAQKLQIEFYERQIREKMRRENEEKSAAPAPYTVTDYTPANVVSTFVPLQQTPDIEKARAHKVDYLPDVVLNETAPHAPAPASPQRPAQQRPAVHAHMNGSGSGEETTEHDSVETRVMRGPVRGVATTTAGVRTRNGEPPRAAADNLRGVLDALAPRRPQVAPAPTPHGPAPVRSPTRNPAPAPARSPAPAPAPVRSPAPAPLSRSGSWHKLSAPPSPQPASPRTPSPRRIVSRAKSMHLLAVPKMFEGGIAREEVGEKKRTVEAYFTGQQTTRSHAAQIRSKSARAHGGGGGFALGRSRTMPSVTELQFLDESNADDAFEDLVSGLA